MAELAPRGQADVIACPRWACGKGEQSTIPYNIRKDARCIMRNPDCVLESLRKQACKTEYKFDRLYRNLYNPEFYLEAYARIARSPGSMTAGADGITLDDMSIPRIEQNRTRRG